MKRGIQGEYIVVSTVDEEVKAFVPYSLPPIPPIEWNKKLRNKFDKALIFLAKLDTVSDFLPNIDPFIYMYVRKEAVLSSMIEGTQSSLSDLLLFELDIETDVEINDVRDVSCYVSALEHGLKRLSNGFPLSLRLIKEMHSILLTRGRGSNQTPGEFRRSQNWIGGTRPGNAFFVPPPVDKMIESMEKLELFLHDQPESTSPLLKAALAHVQFETIHPFLDGNGRLVRLLITLLLCEQGVIKKPMLYLSLYFKTHRAYYYELLNRVRLTGDWELWLEFFADAIIFTATQATDIAKELVILSENDRKKIKTLGRASSSVLKVHEAILAQPIVTSNWLVKKTGITAATINKSLANLEKLNIISEITSSKRNRVFRYEKYWGIMNQGIEI